MKVHPNDYRFLVFEGPNYIGRTYRGSPDAKRFVKEAGHPFNYASVIGDRIVSRFDHLGRKMQPVYAEIRQ